MNNKLTPAGYFRPDGLVLPEVLSGQEFFDIGYQIRLAKKCSSIWMRQWREYGANNYGEDYVEETECKIERQLDLALGLPPVEPAPDVDAGLGKGTAFVSLPGIRQSFDMWRRKATVEKWGSPERKKACELLRPVVEFYDFLLSQEGGAK
jgi:hypothetical protein